MAGLVGHALPVTRTALKRPGSCYAARMTQHPVERKATYVFRRTEDGSWLCAIDSSYGHELLGPVDP